MFDSGLDEAVVAESPEPWNRPDSTARPDGYAALELQSATLNPTELTDAEVIEAVRGYDHVASWAAARQARMLAEFAHRRPPDRSDAVDRATVGAVSTWAPDEIGLALTLSRGTAAARLDRSVRLAQVLPATLAAWDAGLLDQAKVNAIHDATLALSDTIAQAVQDRVLPQAPTQTVGQLRAALERAVIAADPAAADARHRKAYRQRRVALNPDRDGMASLWALLSAPDALTCYGWLTALARGLPIADARSMDARRADLLVALLTGNLLITPTADNAPADGNPTADGPTDGGRTDEDLTNGGPNNGGPTGDDPAGEGPVDMGPTGEDPVDEDPDRRATFTRTDLRTPVAPTKPLVHLVIPLTTLTGADDSPVELTGYGPLPPAMARAVAADGVWKRLVTDPLSGALLDHGRTTYRPPAALAEFLRARDRHCRVPICRRRALDSQLDHTIGYHTDNGTTDEQNLYNACLCHHRMKDAPGWSVAQHPDGRLTWTTPTGHRYTSRPHDYRPEPDLVATITAIDKAARDRASHDEAGQMSVDRPSRSPFVRPTAPTNPADPPPF